MPAFNKADSTGISAHQRSSYTAPSRIIEFQPSRYPNSRLLSQQSPTEDAFPKGHLPSKKSTGPDSRADWPTYVSEIAPDSEHVVSGRRIGSRRNRSHTDADATTSSDSRFTTTVSSSFQPKVLPQRLHEVAQPSTSMRSYANVSAGEPGKRASTPENSDVISRSHTLSNSETNPVQTIDHSLSITTLETDMQMQPVPGREGKDTQNNTGYSILGTFKDDAGPPKDKTKEELKKALSMIENLKMDLRRERHEQRSLKQAYHESEYSRKRLGDTLSSIEHELRNVQRELEESKILSDIRGKELVGAQAFSTKADSLSINAGPLEDETKEESQKALSMIENLKVDLRRERHEQSSLKQAYLESERNRGTLSDTLLSTQQQLQKVQQDFKEYKLQAVVGTQPAFIQADSLTIPDVVKKVEILNKKISQAAVSVGKSVTHTNQDISTDAEQRFQEQSCADSIGQPMTDLLLEHAEQSEQRVNPLLVQATLSMLLVQFCFSKLDRRFPDKEPVSGEQPGSAEHTRSDFRPSWKAELIERLTNIFQISGWNIPFENRIIFFEHKLVPIFEGVENLQTTLWENPTSIDLAVNIAHPPCHFAPWMEDVYGNDPDTVWITPVTVIGTTAIGLKKLMIQRGSRDPHIVDEHLLSPKVILEPTLRMGLKGETPQGSGKLY